MASLRALPPRKVLKVLTGLGFQPVGRRGSHIKLKRVDSSGTRVVIVPDHGDIPVGTLRSILRQAGLTPDEFLDRL